MKIEKVLVERKFLIKREQNLYSNTKNFEGNKQQLNLKVNREGIYECHGCIQGDYLVFIPNNSRKFVSGSSLTNNLRRILAVAKIRDQCWMPTLRQLSKRITKKCYG